MYLFKCLHSREYDAMQNNDGSLNCNKVDHVSVKNHKAYTSADLDKFKFKLTN